MQEYYIGVDSKEKFSAKIIVLGNTLVGKSSILSRYINNIFSENNEYVTIGMDYMIKTLEVDNIQMKLEFWDTAGQERFRSVIQQYYNDSQAAVVVFDLTNSKSFDDLKYWVQQLNEFTDQNLIKVLLGNKTDIDNEIKIQKEEIDKFCNLNDFTYYETSAKLNQNIDGCFMNLARKIKERFFIAKNNSYEKNNGSLRLSDYLRYSPKEEELKEDYCKC